jgi:hypothetical protein
MGMEDRLDRLDTNATQECECGSKIRFNGGADARFSRAAVAEPTKRQKRLAKQRRWIIDELLFMFETRSKLILLLFETLRGNPPISFSWETTENDIF